MLRMPPKRKRPPTGNPLGRPVDHGQSYSRTYAAWRDMCHNHRGDVFRGWISFEVFWRDMGVRPRGARLSRVSKRLVYGPGNTVWK